MRNSQKKTCWSLEEQKQFFWHFYNTFHGFDLAVWASNGRKCLKILAATCYLPSVHELSCLSPAKKCLFFVNRLIHKQKIPNKFWDTPNIYKHKLALWLGILPRLPTPNHTQWRRHSRWGPSAKNSKFTSWCRENIQIHQGQLPYMPWILHIIYTTQ